MNIMTSEKQPAVSVIIVNWNAREMLRGCLESLRENPHNLRIEVILVDNGSSDGSVEMARAEWTGIKIIEPGRNVGYVPANNIGLRHATGRYVFFLNNDTVLDRNALGELVRFLDTHPEAGAASGRIVNPDGTDQGCARSLPSVANAIFGRRSLLTRLWPDNPWTRRYMVCWQRTDDEPYEVEILSSAAIIMPTAAAHELRGMDEDFQLYWVDAELCSRIRRSGFRIFCVPRARIVHFEGHGGSTKTFRMRLRSTLIFHTDAYHAFTKIHQLRAYDPRAVFAAVALSARALALAAAQCLLPARSFSSRAWQNSRPSINARAAE